METTSFPYTKLVVLGTTGSGKSTLACQLADRLSLDRVELDALHWETGWGHAPDDVFRARVEQATRTPRWVSDGNYRIVRDILWPRAEAALWLDYPFGIVFWRLLSRTLRRWWTREELWNGNRERLAVQFKLWSDESIFRWLVKTYGRRKREYPLLFAQSEHQHLKVFRFDNPTMTEVWLNQIKKVP